jgi:hypothetical protein
MRASLASWSAVLLLTGNAAAQAPAAAETGSGVPALGFVLRPLVQVRARAELFAPSADIGQPAAPVLGTFGPTSAAPDDAWVAHERARIGLTAERGIVSGAVVVQDARLWGIDDGGGASVHIGYLEAHASDSRDTFVRIGRQEITWGSGRLLGISDFSPTPRALDAARAKTTIGIFDFEVLASILAPPGAIPPEAPGTSVGAGSGAQLYGLDAALHIDPLLQVELLGLARIARNPLPAWLLPSDTYVTSLRTFGAWDEWSYGLEGALELGRVGVAGGHKKLVAGATTAHVDWQPGVPSDPTLSLSGSYASGGDGGGTMHRFDPILPDDRAGLGQMGLYTWSNLVEGALCASIVPFDGARVRAGYHYVRLANAGGPWYAASLTLIGQDDTRASGMLGHEVDGAITYDVAPGLELVLGYGAMFTGNKARAILRTPTQAAPNVLHAAFLQATLTAP